MSYALLEPRPSPAATHHGRGGAGNTHALSSTTLAKGTSSAHARAPPAQLNALYGSKISTGRGGAGNAYPASERAIFSFDEELERRRMREEHAAPVYHVGRGGAGNIHGLDRAASATANAAAATTSSSAGSTRSGADSAWNRVSATFSRA